MELTTPQIPDSLFVVYWKGKSDQWYFSFPTQYYENAVAQATAITERSPIIVKYGPGTRVRTVKKIPSANNK